MANVVNKADPGNYRLSVNTPDFAEADWLINPPGLLQLLTSGVATKYWKVVGGNVAEMDASEKQTVDDADDEAQQNMMLAEASALVVTDSAIRRVLFALSVVQQREFRGIKRGSPRPEKAIALMIPEVLAAIQNEEIE